MSIDEDIAALAVKVASLGNCRVLTTEQALEQVIATGSPDVREYARLVLARVVRARAR